MRGKTLSIPETTSVPYEPVSLAGRRRNFAAVVAIIAVTVDLVVAAQWWGGYGERAILALIWCGLLVAIWDGPSRELGLQLRPVQGVRYWFKMTAIIAGGVGTALVAFFAIWSLVAPLPEIPTLNPGAPLWPTIVYRCVDAPIVEEAIYRFVLCMGLLPVCGRWTTITTSTAAFGGLHVLYGNPSPENLLGGAVLAWAFLKSRSMLVPVLLHSAGNAVVTAVHFAACYLMTHP